MASALPSLSSALKSGKSFALGKAGLAVGELADDLVDLVADLLVVLRRNHIGKATACRHVYQALGSPAYLSETYLTNSKTRT